MVGHPGRAFRGIVSLLRLRSRMRETMGHFSSNPSPPSTGRALRRLASSQRPHCFPTLSACFSMTTDGLFISFRMTPTTTQSIHPEINSNVTPDLQNLAFPDCFPYFCVCAHVCVHAKIISKVCHQLSTVFPKLIL